MAEVFKRLSSGTSASNVTYTVPSNTSAVVSSISISNMTYGTPTFSVYVYGPGQSPNSTNIIYSNITVAYQEPVLLEPAITLGPGETVFIDMDTNLTASIFGSEVSGFDGYRIIAQSRPSANAVTDLYEPADGFTGLIRSIVICDTNSNNGSIFNISIKNTGENILDSDYLFYRYYIPKDETIVISCKYPVEYGHTLCYENLVGTGTVTVFGVEYANN